MASLPPRAREFLEPALTEGWTWEGVEERILTDFAQLWINDTAAVVTEYAIVWGEVHLHAWLGGGSLRGLLNLRPEIERYARDAGCVVCTIAGRPGWDRIFRPFGYVRRGDELELRL
jgi:hypothetical protein